MIEFPKPVAYIPTDPKNGIEWVVPIPPYGTPLYTISEIKKLIHYVACGFFNKETGELRSGLFGTEAEDRNWVDAYFKCDCGELENFQNNQEIIIMRSEEFDEKLMKVAEVVSKYCVNDDPPTEKQRRHLVDIVKKER